MVSGYNKLSTRNILCVLLCIKCSIVQSCDVSLSTERTIVEIGSRVAMTCTVCPGNSIVRINLNGMQIADYWKPVNTASVSNTSAYSISTDILNNETHIYLTVLSLTKDQAGTYTCQIAGTQNQSSVTLLYAADSCEVSLTTVRTIVELDSTVSMTCRVCPKSYYVYIYLNGNLVADYWKTAAVINQSAYSVSTDIKNNITYIHLTVLSFTRDKAGNYTCIIAGQNNRSSIVLFYAVPVNYVEIKPRVQTVSLLNNVTTNMFSCTSSTGRPTPVIRWYTDNKTPGYYVDDSDITTLASNFTISIASGDTTISNLTFTPSTDDHGKMLYCNVSNGYGQMMSNTTPLIEILHPVSTPIIYHVGPSKAIDKITVIRGQSAPLQCNSSSHPPPTYVWSLEGEFIAQGAFNNRTIKTDSVVVCNASNCMVPTGNTKVCSSRLAYLNITTYFPPDKPVLHLRTCGSSVVSTSTIKVIEGHSVDVLCTSVSNPEPTYLWNSSMSIPGNVLTLENVTANQNASYSCTALNVMNTTFYGVAKGTNTSMFYLEVLVPPRVHQMENLTVLLDANLSVVCPFTVGNPPSTTIEWIRENMTRSLGPSLSITGIKLADEGTYICAVSNTMEPTNCNSQKGYTRNSLHLDIQYAAKITDYFANGFKNQNVITVNEYENVKMECVFDSDPVANISIVNGTRMLESGKTNTLIASIPHVRCEYDATVYRCRGGNIHSTETQERVLEVFIKCAPRPSPFYPPVTNISRTLNGSAVLTFTIKAYPKPDISAYSWCRLIGLTWKIITDVNSVQSVSADGLQTNLSVLRLQIEDFGRYRVSVFNELGNATQEYELRAHDKPETPKNIHVKEGSLGVDSFTVEWEPGYHGGEDQTFVIIYTAKQSSLLWTDVNVSSNSLNYSIIGLHSGTTYFIKMFARNIVGKSEETDVVTATTLVILAESPFLLTAVAVGTTVGGIFCITLSAVGVWCMVKRKHPKQRPAVMQYGQRGHDETFNTNACYDVCKFDSRPENKYEALEGTSLHEYSSLSLNNTQRKNTESAANDSLSSSTVDKEYENLRLT